MKKIAVVVCILLLLVPMTINVYAIDENATVHNILENAVEHDGNYYLIIDGKYTWNEAKLYCEGLGGHLATISSQSEDDICYQLWQTTGKNACWLGGTDEKIEGIWNWITSENWSFSNWGGEEPNGGTGENYLCYYGDYANGRWNDCDDDGDSLFPFICEWEEENVDYVCRTYGYLTSSGVIYNNAFYYNGNIYKIFNYDMSSADAKAYCENLGGHLATISSLGEDKAIYSYISKNGSFECVLGGTDEKNEGTWEWVNGEPFSYSNWNIGEPNDQNGEDYLQYSKDSGKWNDIKWQKVFLCEWENCCILNNGTVTNHQFGENIITQNPSCTSMGQSQKICTQCGTIVTSNIENLPHDCADWIITTKATCHTTGERTKECNDCDYSEIQTIEILDHQWSEWTVSNPATCHGSGITERVCSLCGDKEQQTLEQLTHEYGEFSTIKGSKLIPPIVKEKTCFLCGDAQREEDWGYIWVPIVVGAVAIFALFGIVNYIKAIKKR